MVGTFLMAGLVWTIWALIGFGLAFFGVLVYFTAREWFAARNPRPGYIFDRERDDRIGS